MALTDEQLCSIWEDAWQAAPESETIHDLERRALRAVAEAAVADFAAELMA